MRKKTKLSYKRSKLSKLSAEQEALLKQEKELRQKEERLRKQLQQLPSALEEKRHYQKQHPYAKTIHTTLVGTVDSPGLSSWLGRKRPPRRGSPLKEKRAAKIKFIILMVILASLLVLIWRSLPS